jgi:iron complex outermembrane receptor protein
MTLIYANEDQGTDENVPSGILDLDTVDTFGVSPGVAFDPGTGFWPSNQNRLSHDLNESNKLETTIGIVNFAQQISDQMTFKAVAGVIDATQKRLFDNDLIGNLDLLARTNKYDGNSYSVEARVESKSDAVDWVVGALYAHDQQKQYNDVAVSSDPTATINGVGFLPPFPQGLGLALNTKNFEVDSAAVFADATWHATDRLDVILGARYTSDDVLNARTSYGLAPSCGCGPPDPAFFPSFVNFPRPNASGKSTFSDVSPRGGLRFAWSETGSVYLTASKGYKAGGDSTGNNTNAPGSPAVDVPFNEETLWNYEVGIKTEFADRRVRLNASVFYLDWKNLQVEAFRFLTPGDLSSNFEQTVNVDSKGKGAEVELLAQPWKGFTIGGSLGYLDTEITKEPVCDVAGGPPTCVQITGGFTPSVIGLDMPKAPKHTLDVFGEFRWPVGTNSTWVRAEVTHRGSQYSDIEALTNLQTRGPSPNQGLTRVVGPNEFPYKIPAYDVVNLRFGYEWQRASLTLYAQNLFSEVYYTGTQENFGLSGIRLRPHPAIYGFNVSFNF